MAMQGDLQHMAVADLIQHNCQDRKTAQLIINQDNHQAILFFKDGTVQHASLDDDIYGEEVVYKILNWQNGHFSLEMGQEPPTVTIERSWSGLLLEGARRLDEAQVADQSIEANMEVNNMASELDNILKDLSEQVDGFIATGVVGMDGFGIGQYTKSNKLDIDTINAQMTMFIKLVDTSVNKLGAGTIEDNLLTTDKAYLLVRFLEDKSYYLGIAADRKKANLGNMRLVSRVFSERLAQAMPK
jgi:predicted regulator of Ras-like GTPase activity (Roadblock/LC7/MglB family)